MLLKLFKKTKKGEVMASRSLTTGKEIDRIAKSLLLEAGYKEPIESDFRNIDELLENRSIKIRALEDGLRGLRSAEENNNLGWMDYASWLASTSEFQTLFKATVEPVFWGAAYFLFDKFLSCIPVIVTVLPENSEAVVFKSGHRYQFAIYNKYREEKLTLKHQDILTKNTVILRMTREGVSYVREDYSSTLRNISEASDKTL